MLGDLFAEAHMVRSEVNRASATQAMVVQQAVSSVLSKEGHKAFIKFVERLNNG